VRTLVATEGYYSPTVRADLETGGAALVAHVVVDPGQPVLVGDVELLLLGFAPIAPGPRVDADSLRARWGLPVGRRFRTADWEAAKRNLLRQVAQERYPRAQLTESSAIVDPDVYRALLKVAVDSGPEVHFDGLRIEGLKRYPPTIINNLNQIKPGDVYSEAALQALQARLQDTGYFSGVDVSADLGPMLDESLGALAEQQEGAPRPAPAGPVVTPVVVRVTENKQKTVGVGLGYSTNTGNRAGIAYDDLSVFGLRMKSNIVAETLRQSARVDFYWPTTPKGYNDSVGAGVERNDVRGERTTVTKLAARRAWGSPLLERSLTLEYLSEKRNVLGEAFTTSSKSVPLTFSITKRKLDNLLSPTSGYAVNAQLGGAIIEVKTYLLILRHNTLCVGDNAE
jgi:translocation and assembly module TamA